MDKFQQNQEVKRQFIKLLEKALDPKFFIDASVKVSEDFAICVLTANNRGMNLKDLIDMGMHHDLLGTLSYQHVGSRKSISIVLLPYSSCVHTIRVYESSLLGSQSREAP